ncbi:MAG TPA: redoxin family protein [Alphaproteobacteria bacterium]
MTQLRISLWGTIPLIALTALAVLLLFRLENPRVPGSVDSPLIGKSLPDLGIAIKGPVIVNVFASWCAPCKVEHPFLLVAKSRGTRIVGIAYKDKKENIDHYLSNLGNPYDVLAYDETGMIGINLGISGVPESYFVDSDGIVRRRLQGPFASVPDVIEFVKDAP